MMIKPASAACNLRCDYCFYFDEADTREEGNPSIDEPRRG